jgi:hypothetical protein
MQSQVDSITKQFDRLTQRINKKLSIDDFEQKLNQKAN